MKVSILPAFFQKESFLGILLGLASLLGLGMMNSAFAPHYDAFLHYSFALGNKPLTVSFIVNEGLMTLFFLWVGLEIKREVLVGELNTFRKALLPGFAAIGGMLAPALIYFLVNISHPLFHDGWAIPTATDIAFALGVLNLCGKRLPSALKVFLMALAIFDDLGAVLIIALFYTHQLFWKYLVLAAIIFSVLSFLQSKRVFPYAIGGTLLWLCLLKAGIHPTIAGVLLALTIPLKQSGSQHQSLLCQTEKHLHPWVSYLILPLFAFCNSGLDLSAFTPTLLLTHLPLGIILGLVMGKPLGILGAMFIAVKTRLAVFPRHCHWGLFCGLSLLCGIGFTMSLFIGGLAFSASTLMDLARLGIFLGSLISGVSGYLVLRYGCKR